MNVRPIALLLFTSVSPLIGATVIERVDRLEGQVSELQLLLNQIKKRSPHQGYANTQSTRGSGGYIVKSGDSYWKIARKLGVSVNDLQSANPGISPRRLAIGKEIKVPGGSRSESTSTRNSGTSTGGWTASYKVRQGDILGRIAENHGIRLHQLMSANPGLDPLRLRVGKTLNIPGQQRQTTTKAAPTPKPTAPVIRERRVALETTSPPIRSREVAPRETPPPRSTPDSSQWPQGVGARRNSYLSSNAQPVANRTMRNFSEMKAPEPRLVPVARDSRLVEIARLHNTTVKEINRLNNVDLSSEQMIRSGSQLYVPGR